MTATLDLAARRNLLVRSGATFLKEHVGLDIGAEKLAVIIGEDLDWEVEDENVIYDPESPYMDTAIREYIMDCVADYYLGTHWPCNCDKVDMNEFFAKLDAAIATGK